MTIEATASAAFFSLIGGVFPFLLGIILPYIVGNIEFWKRVSPGLSLGVLIFFLFEVWLESAGLGTLTSLTGLGSLLLPLTLFGLFAVGLLVPTRVGLILQGKHAGGRSELSTMSLAYIWAFGLGIDSLAEGIVLGSEISAGVFSLTLSQALSFSSHKALEGFTLFTLLLRAAGGARNIAWLAIIAASPAVLGASSGTIIEVGLWPVYLFALAAGFVLLPILYLVRETRDKTLGLVFLLQVLLGITLLLGSAILHLFE